MANQTLDTTLTPSLINHYGKLELLELTKIKYMNVVRYLMTLKSSFQDPNNNIVAVKTLPNSIKKEFPISWYDSDMKTITIPTEFYSQAYFE